MQLYIIIRYCIIRGCYMAYYKRSMFYCRSSKYSNQSWNMFPESITKINYQSFSLSRVSCNSRCVLDNKWRKNRQTRNGWEVLNSERRWSVFNYSQRQSLWRRIVQTYCYKRCGDYYKWRHWNKYITTLFTEL